MRALLSRLFSAGNESPGEGALSAILDVEEPDKGKEKGPDKIHEQILHGIQKPDVQIAAQAQGPAIDIDLLDVVDVIDLGASRRIQHDRGDAVDDGILLHVHIQVEIHRAFEELPENTHRHGKAEGDDGHVQRGEAELDPFVRVQQIH